MVDGEHALAALWTVGYPPSRIQGMMDGGLLAQSYELGQHSHKVIG
jgi:hypothetical protein